MMKNVGTNNVVTTSSVADHEQHTDTNTAIEQNNNEEVNEEEILCHACGFSSEFVPEGMLTCQRCTDVQYCSVECRDWEWTNGHQKVCKANDVTPSTTKADGKFGESFSDGSVSVASIDLLNLFDKRQSPLFSKNKLGLVSQTEKGHTSIASPKENNNSIKTSDKSPKPSSTSVASSTTQNAASNNVKRGPNVSKTLGKYLGKNTPDRNVASNIPTSFMTNTDDDDDDSDDDDNNEHGNDTNSRNLRNKPSDYDFTDEESMGLSVLEVESDNNLTVIVEESNVMSVPVIEASWRRNASVNRRNTRSSDLSILEMEDSEIIGSDSIVELMKQTEMSLQQQDDLAYGVKANMCIESNSSLLGNHNTSAVHLSVNSSSMGGMSNTETENSDHEDLNYSDGSYSLIEKVQQTGGNIEQPEVVESSNSSDSATTNPTHATTGTIGRRAMVIERGPSLRGFRDIYNDCDTASLHSRSIARSNSSSEDSLSSHLDVADLPERLHRSSSSLKDFREIYNANLITRLLPRQQSGNSLGCSSSFDDYNVEIPVENEHTKWLASQNPNNNVSDGSNNKESSLSSQLELIASKSERHLNETNEAADCGSPSRSDDASSLQVARQRNESMKQSLNSALRVYEQMYGEEAAKEVFYQLTNNVDPKDSNEQQSSSEQLFEWKRAPAPKEQSRPDDSITESKTIPKYMQYRTTLSSKTLSEVSTSKSIEVPDDIRVTSTDNGQLSASNSISGSVRYLQYREKLQKDTSSLSILENVGMSKDLTNAVAPTKEIGYEQSMSIENVSIGANSSSDVGFQSLDNLHVSSNVGVVQDKKLGPKPPTRNQFNQRYLQYRKSIEGATVSSIPIGSNSSSFEKSTDLQVRNNVEPFVQENVAVAKSNEQTTTSSSSFNLGSSKDGKSIGDLTTPDRIKMDESVSIGANSSSNVGFQSLGSLQASSNVGGSLQENEVPVADSDSNEKNGFKKRYTQYRSSIQKSIVQKTTPCEDNSSSEVGYQRLEMEQTDNTEQYASSGKVSNESMSEQKSMFKQRYMQYRKSIEKNIGGLEDVSVDQSKLGDYARVDANSSSDDGYQTVENLQSSLELDNVSQQMVSTESKLPNQKRYMQYRMSIENTLSTQIINSCTDQCSETKDNMPSTKNVISLPSSSPENAIKVNKFDNTEEGYETNGKVAEMKFVDVEDIPSETKASSFPGSRYMQYRQVLTKAERDDASSQKMKAVETINISNKPLHENGFSSQDTLSIQKNAGTMHNDQIRSNHEKPQSHSIYVRADDVEDVTIIEKNEEGFSSSIKNQRTSDFLAVPNPDITITKSTERIAEPAIQDETIVHNEVKADNVKACDDIQLRQNNRKDVDSEDETVLLKATKQVSHRYQIVDVDEVTVTSDPSDRRDTEHSIFCRKPSLSNNGLDVIGYNGIRCSGANMDSFLNVWNDMEADRRALHEERSIKRDGSKQMPISVTQNKTDIAPNVPPKVNGGENASKDFLSMDHADIENGLLSSNYKSSFDDGAMKLRAIQFRRKQRFLCFVIVSLLIALPIGIGLGVGLSDRKPVFEGKSLAVSSKQPAPNTAISPFTTPVMKSPTLAPMMKLASIPPTIAPVIVTTNPLTNTPIAIVPSTAPTATKLVTSTPTRSPFETSVPVVQTTASPVSSTPTAQKTKTKDELFQLVSTVSSDNGTAILSQGSPQFQAFQWLVLDQSVATYSDERIIQRYALATFYYSTDGANWSDNVGWLSKLDECMWYTIAAVENCDAENALISLDLSANDLTGVIPNELALLSRLESLRLSGGPSRFIGGVIPPALGTMDQLKILDFQNNYFFGRIPSELGQLERLEVLDLSMNRLSRTIPTEIGRLQSMKRLSVAMNQLTGEIPSSINSMIALETLSLGDNNLSGKTLDGSSLVYLKELNLEKNQFTVFGSDIGRLEYLETLTIYENSLIGPIPSQIGSLSMLKRLDLHTNQLTGSIPSEIGNLIMLTNLDLSMNELTNRIPTNIGLLTNLKRLNLQRNLLQGPIPNELGKLSSASIIHINDNNISGLVPDEVCEHFGLYPVFYLDCLERSDGSKELTCPAGTCCSFCCNDGGCECSHKGTPFEFLCNVQ